MDITTYKTAFRNPNYAGDGETDPVEVMLFEIMELGNTDIFDTLLESDLIKNSDIIERMRSASEYIEENGGPGYYDEDDYTDDDRDIKELIKSIPDEIARTTGKTINFVLWLASKSDVEARYEGTGDNIIEYPTSDIILSNLGDEGALFAYETRPEPVGE